MKFGIHSLLFTETFLDKDLPLLQRCKEMGFDAVEIIPFDPDNFPAKKVRQVAKDLDLTINTGYGLPAEFNTISPDPAVRKKGVEFSKRLIDLSTECGAEVFGGVIYCAWGYLSGTMRTEDEWKWGVDSCRQVAEYAAANSPVIIGIEPVNRFESHFINIAADAVRLVEEVGLPNVKVHLDTFHMIREENNLLEAIRTAGPHLGYLHACENQRGIPGTGQIPWRDVLATLKEVGYDGCITIESFDPNLKTVAKLCCIWRQFADSPEQLATEGLRFIKETYADVYGAR
ncbi:MAG: sugar phosphate isomerase/epimerase [Pirellulaceae bacterium]